MPLKVGDSFPEGVQFGWIPYTPEAEGITSCGVPTKYNASKEWADKKVVIFALPGAFTPSCSASHLPGFIAKRDELLKKGVDVIACLAYNDPFVMSAWGKANNVKGEDILFLTDENAEFSKAHGWALGERTSRYALVIDHGKVTYAEVEPSPQFGVSVSSAESVLEKL